LSVRPSPLPHGFNISEHYPLGETENQITVAQLLSQPVGDSSLSIFKASSFKYIYAVNVLQAISDLELALQRLKDLLVPGGFLHITVPADLSIFAWDNPAHIRAFNEHSFDELDVKLPKSISSPFELKCIGVQPIYSDLGFQLLCDGVDTRIISNTPRAINSFKYLLAKRYKHFPVDSSMSLPKKYDYSIQCFYKHQAQADDLYTISQLSLLSDCLEQPPNLSPESCIPRVSLCTPTVTGREHLLVRLLHHIINQEYPADLIEWIIAPDVISDNLLALVELASKLIDVCVIPPSECLSLPTCLRRDHT